MTASSTAAPRIAYLLKRYPRLSETFILHEILELERLGVDLTLFALLDPREQLVHADVARVKVRPRYFPVGWRGGPALARAHLTLLARRPRRYLATAAEALAQAPRPARLKHFLRAGWLALELEKQSVTHLHAHFANVPAAIAYFLHRLTGLPFSFTAHAKDIYTSPPAMLGTKMRAARFVVTCTEFNRRYLTNLLPEESRVDLRRVYHGVDLNRFTPGDAADSSARSDTSPPIILSVGRLVPKKGFPDLIEACCRLRERGYDFQLTIVGSGELKDELRARIAAAGLAARVVLLGSRPQEELVARYREATIFALPCVVLDNGDRDGIPNVLVEAMSVGVPVISTTVSGIPELIRDGETGLLVPPSDPDALADALARLLDSAVLRERLATAGRRWVRAEFDLQANAEKLHALFAGSQSRYLPEEPPGHLARSGTPTRGEIR